MVNDYVFVAPEEEGLSSEKVVAFLDYIQEWKIPMHSFMLIKRGKILAEGYCKPFHKDFKHRLYSCSKSIVALAIGKLVGENKIRLSDKICDYFPNESAGKDLHPYIRDLTIENMLTMTNAHQQVSYGFQAPHRGLRFLPDKWVESFFNPEVPIIKPNGTLFYYDTACSFMLNVLVERLTGKTFLEYLRPEFDEIGVAKDIVCVQSPDGYSWGGSGVICTLRDFAKIGEWLLYKGEYKGKQLLPREYMERATTKQVDLDFSNGYHPVKEGYGYQIWMHKYGYGMHGMGSQIVWCFPDKEFTFVCQSDTQSLSEDYYTRYYHAALELYKSISDSPLPENEAAFETLQNRLENLELVKGFGEKTSPWAEKLRGKRYELDKNDMGIKWIEFAIDDEQGKMIYENERGVKEIPFGMESYTQFTFPETHYYAERVYTPANRGLQAIACGSWTSENRLLVRINFIEWNFGHVGMTFYFDGDTLAMRSCPRAEGFAYEYEGYAIGKLVK